MGIRVGGGGGAGREPRERGTAIAHCPLSNFFFAKGALPVKQLVSRGVKVPGLRV